MIVDASVAVKWLTIEALHEEARDLLAGPEPLLAPDVLAVEVAHALWVKVGWGELDGSEAARAVAGVSGGGQPELRPSLPLTAKAFRMAGRLEHRSTTACTWCSPRSWTCRWSRRTNASPVPRGPQPEAGSACSTPDGRADVKVAQARARDSSARTKRKVLTPNDFHDLDEVASRLLAFQER